MNPLFTIIIPGKNESENIPSLFERIDRSLTSEGILYKMVFINDGSTDPSDVVLKAMQLKYPLIVISHEKSIGKAGSLIEGIQLSTTEYVVMIDADLQYPPEAIPQMWRKHVEYPIVVARRSVHNESIVRRMPSMIHSFLYCRLLFGLTCDVQSGLKLFPKKLLDYLDLKDITPWTLDLALLVAGRAHGIAIGEVDIVFEDRAFGSSKVNVLRSFWEHSVSALRLKLKSF